MLGEQNETDSANSLELLDAATEVRYFYAPPMSSKQKKSRMYKYKNMNWQA